MRRPKVSGPALRRIAVDTAEVVTVDTTLDGRDARDFGGQFVRLRPEASVEDDEIKAVVARLRTAGAFVRVEQAAKAAKLVMDKGVALSVTKVTREWVITEAMKTSSKDPEQLRRVIEQLADEAGL